MNGKFVPKAFFYCIYDKKKRKLRSTKGHGLGFIDDIDCLEYFCPKFVTNSELIDVISAEKWLDWSAKKIKLPINIKVNFDDNPILRIVHFRI